MALTLAHSMPFGAAIGDGGVRFRLWAPDVEAVELLLSPSRWGRDRFITMERGEEGWFEAFAPGAGAGNRYRFRADGGIAFPDPASRYQPEDVHGASEVIDPADYRWKTTDWRGRPWEEVVLYELHIGTFAQPNGTFTSAIKRLDYLVELGVTAIELMPVADFPGRYDWGYDGVQLFAPDSRYGRPEAMKALIDAAHARGLMVFLDVVYNHFGPEGNYLHVHAKSFFNFDRHTPWGAAINFDGKDSRPVRDFFVHNVLYWIKEFNIDGLRFDAVHAIDDRSDKHILTEIAERVWAAVPADRHVHLVLENDSNEARFLGRAPDGTPTQYVAQWNDDIHHCFHVLLTGEDDGYYADYADDPSGHLIRCLTEGFAYQGDPSPYRGGEIRGEASADLPPTAFVNFIQNHDQIGNRAFGERISALAPMQAIHAAAAVLLLSPSIPMLFMGEEWGASEPFLFFCNFGEELQDAVREGRRKEFAGFARFAEPEARAAIPDPNAPETLEASVLRWSEQARAVHRQTLTHYRTLLAVRQREIVPHLARTGGGVGRRHWRSGRAFQVGWTFGDGARLHLIANLSKETASAPPERLPGRVVFACGNGGASGGTLPPWSVTFTLETPTPEAETSAT